MADVFEKTHCSDQDACLHKDPRHLLFAHQSPARRFSKEKGLRLSRTRAEILESLIPHDPQRAIELAVSPERIRNLPPAIRENMENWHVTQADLKAVHVCFNHKSPEGRIKRWVTLPDGRTRGLCLRGSQIFANGQQISSFRDFTGREICSFRRSLIVSLDHYLMRSF